MVIDLQWKDIKYIVEQADEILANTDKKVLLYIGEVGYYSKVLKAFENLKTALNNYEALQSESNT